MKKILLTQRITENTEYPERRDALDVRWASLLMECSLLPIPYPSNSSAEVFVDELHPDGIILTGGNDLSSVCDDELSKERDRNDGALLELALERKIPVLAVCRGMQFCVERFGLELRELEGHVGKHHELAWASDSRLVPTENRPESVNSFHNYVLEGDSEELLIVARAAGDGSIEAVEHRTLPLVGIMWHPERDDQLYPFERSLLKSLFT